MNTVHPLGVVIVDDHAVVRQGTRNMLEHTPDITVVGECADGEALHQLLQKETPDILLLDVNLPGKSGLQLLAELKPSFPDLKIILFSAHTEPQYIRKAKQLGANGYFSKMIDAKALQDGILKVGKHLEPWVLSEDLLPEVTKGQPTDIQTHLTARELEILAHLGQGGTNQAIAKSLCLSVKTVDTHIANLIKKTGVKNRTQLLAYAYEHHLL
ncbi:MAG TPA: response regulator transcription factor [Oculatellaceae cyanobacterium]|jgi:two-component system response regulator DegU